MKETKEYYREQQRLWLDKYKITQKVVASEAEVTDRTVRNYLDGISDNASVDAAIVKLVKAARLSEIDNLKQEVEKINQKHEDMTGKKIPKKILASSFKHVQEYKFAQ